jgi:hypothetical protein
MRTTTTEGSVQLRRDVISPPRHRLVLTERVESDVGILVANLRRAFLGRGRILSPEKSGMKPGALH